MKATFKSPQSKHRQGLIFAFMLLLHRDSLRRVGFSKSTEALWGIRGKSAGGDGQKKKSTDEETVSRSRLSNGAFTKSTP